jgi:hypothetical protein
LERFDTLTQPLPEQQRDELLCGTICLPQGIFELGAEFELGARIWSLRRTVLHAQPLTLGPLHFDAGEAPGKKNVKILVIFCLMPYSP